MKHARRHYGISVGMPFREDKDPETKAYTHEFGDMKYCMGRMKWLISKVRNELAFLFILLFKRLTKVIFRAIKYSRTLSDLQIVLSFTGPEKRGIHASCCIHVR
jgi:hypothetical protein